MTSGKPHIAWGAHLKTPEQKEEFYKTIKSSRVLIDRFIQLLDHMETNIVNDANSIKQYEHPSWAYRQAHQNGRSSVLQQIKDLFQNL